MKILCILCLLPIFGFSCEQSDKDLVLDFFNEWAVAKGVMNEDGSPNMWNAGMRMAGVSTGDPQADAAIDIGLATKGVRDADKALKEVEKELDKERPDYQGSLEILDAAQKKRPGDWKIRNQRLIVLAESGQAHQMQNDLKQGPSKDQCRMRTGGVSDYCLKRMYLDRSLELGNSSARQIENLPASSGPNSLKVSCNTYQLQIDTYQNLIQLDPKNKDQHQQNLVVAQANAAQPGTTCRQ